MDEKQKSLIMPIVLTIVTCGIYGIYWLICLNDEVNTLSGNTQDASGGMVFLLNLVTCGIYQYYWLYKMGEKLDGVAASKGMETKNRSIVYLICGLCPIIGYALIQNSLNELA